MYLACRSRFVMKVNHNSIVKLKFKIRLKDGSIADESSNYGEDFQFEMGTGTFSEKFESELVGLEKGSNKKIMLQPKDAFGEPHPSLIYQVPKEKFPKDIVLEEGLIVAFSQPNGDEMPGLITKMFDTEVTVDFNHPLSGQVVLIEANILDISHKELSC